MSNFKLDELKVAARGQWKSILASICAVAEHLLDGSHHPCPKCGGFDRFRMINESAGSLFCNQCFSTKNGDGVAAVMWLLGCDFKDAIEKIGNYLGLKPVKPKRDPAAKLQFVEWNDLAAATWCLKKKPITIDQLKAVGAKQAIYRKQYRVIAIPVWAINESKIVGWSLYNIGGGTLPKFKPDGKVDQVKVKLTFGSKPGLMGKLNPDSAIVYKTEGPSDLSLIHI